MEKIRVVIVDDERDVLNAIVEGFDKEKYEVIPFYLPEEALLYLRENGADVVVSDIVMPGMDGYEFYKKVKMVPQLKSIPFIFLTIKGGVEDRIKGYNMGVDDYITKPVRIKELVARIKIVLKRKRVYEEGIEQLINSSDTVYSVVFIGYRDNTLDEWTNYLRSKGIKVWWATYPEEIEEMIYVYMPELIILTWHNRENNLEILEKLKDMSLNIPVVIVIKDKDDYDIYDSMKVGIVYENIDKSVFYSLVVNKIESFCNMVKEKKHIIDTTTRLLIKRILPVENELKVGKWNIKFHYYQSPVMITGAYYDYITLEGGDTFVVIGDLMGYKWNGGLFVSPLAAYIITSIRTLINKEDNDIRKILLELFDYVLNQFHLSSILNGITIFKINSNDNNMEYASVNMPIPILWNEKGIKRCNYENYSDVDSYPIFYGKTFLSKGDVIIGYNEGVKEILDKEDIFLSTYAKKDIYVIYDRMINMVDHNIGNKDCLFVVLGVD